LNGVLLFIVLNIIGCTYDKSEMQPAMVLPDSVSFHKHILPLFNQYCYNSGCHSRAGHLELSDSLAYMSLFARQDIDTLHPTLSVLYVSMNSVNPTMPPSGRLSDYDVALVLKWIEQKVRDN